MQYLNSRTNVQTLWRIQNAMERKKLGNKHGCEKPRRAALERGWRVLNRAVPTTEPSARSQRLDLKWEGDIIWGSLCKMQYDPELISCRGFHLGGYVYIVQVWT
jgi:hypothetical protein